MQHFVQMLFVLTLLLIYLHHQCECVLHTHTYLILLQFSLSLCIYMDTPYKQIKITIEFGHYALETISSRERKKSRKLVKSDESTSIFLSSTTLCVHRRAQVQVTYFLQSVLNLVVYYDYFINYTTYLNAGILCISLLLSTSHH